MATIPDIDQDPPDWRRKKRVFADHPFLPLTGEEGEVILNFIEPPTPATSAFDPEKTEWRFHVAKYCGGELEEYVVTESGDNFLAELTEATNNGETWGRWLHVKWGMKRSSKGRRFKDFSMVEITDDETLEKLYQELLKKEASDGSS